LADESWKIEKTTNGYEITHTKQTWFQYASGKVGTVKRYILNGAHWNINGAHVDNAVDNMLTEMLKEHLKRINEIKELENPQHRKVNESHNYYYYE
jgi:hypothetical protein